MIESVKQIFLPTESDKQYSRIQMPELVQLFVFLAFFALTICTIVIVWNAIEHAPKVSVVIDSDNLNSAQLKQLNKAIDKQPSGSFFSTDLQGLKDNITALSWVDRVSITRDWHKGIRVQALARQPIARFGSEHLLDAQGKVYAPADDDVLTAYDLVSLQGEEKQAEVIMNQMQQVNEWFAPLGLFVEDMILTPRMTWLIKFNSDLRVLVDGENTSQKLLNLSNILQDQLADKKDDIDSIDLRYKNGFAISWKTPEG